MLEARNKFKLRSLTVDCRAEDADIDADALADSKCRPSHGQQPQLNQKSVFICNGNDAALMTRLPHGANRGPSPLIFALLIDDYDIVFAYRIEPTPQSRIFSGQLDGAISPVLCIIVSGKSENG